LQVETMREKHERPERAVREGGGPVRTCVGCGKTDDTEALVRIVLGPRVPGEGAPVAVDMAGGSHGRGAHVHARPECLAKAAKAGLARSFKGPISTTAMELAEQIVLGADRRIAGLLTGAHRARLVAIGADAAGAALDEGAPGVVVAADAGAVTEKGAIARAIAAGRAVAWKDKQTLGALLGGRDEVAVCAVLNDSIAAQVASARRLADAVSGQTGTTGPARGDACSRSREVR
jgi:predicted RNA-binding protein YlxR (DUF448 family)